MKIALVSDCYLPRLGGIEVQVRDLGHRLLAAGHDVEVLTATVGAHGERGGTVEELGGIPVHRLGRRVPGDLPINVPVGELRRRLGGRGYDVAHVHMGVVSPFTVGATGVARRLGLPTTMTWHSLLGPCEGVMRLSGAARRWAASGVAMNAVSSVAAAPVQRLVGAAASVTLLPNGIDVERWWTPNETRPAPPLGPDGTVHLVTAMRLVARKRPMPMLAVLQRVRATVPEVPIRVSILGDGWQRRRLAAHVRRERLDWVELAGRVSREELLLRYANAHLYLSPARLESFGIAALEARCTGLPVVGLATSGAVDFVFDGVNGFLGRDDDAMAAAIVRLLRDPALRERMRHHNVSVPPDQFDWSTVVVTAEGEYERAKRLDRRAGPARPGPVSGLVSRFESRLSRRRADGVAE